MSPPARRDTRIAAIDEMSVDDLLVSIDPEILKALEIDDDLRSARNDSRLLETLRVTYEILATLRVRDVLDTFQLLPRSDQSDFLRWIGMTDDPRLRRDRASTFASALEESPLAGTVVARDIAEPHSK